MTVTNAQRILLESQPRGRFFEGTLASGQTPKPGQAIRQNTDGTWSAGCGLANGGHDMVAILLENDLEGIPSSTAYADGAHFFAYIPAAGERMYILVKNVTGTDTFAIGDLMMFEYTTGKLLANSSGSMVPFIIDEAIVSAVWTADTLVLCKSTGN